MSTTAPPVADPRPRTSGEGGDFAVVGWRCTACAHPSTTEVLRCPLCRSDVAEATFAPTGEVWASTTLRVRVPGRTPPFSVAYVVLDGGPRILVHTTGDQPLAPGTRAVVTGTDEHGDLVATGLEDAR